MVDAESYIVDTTNTGVTGTTASVVNQPFLVYTPPVADTGGTITAAALNAGGADYAPGDTVQVDGFSGDSVLTVNTVNGGGAVLTFTITDGGTGNQTGTGLATSANTGIGTGFTVNITQVEQFTTGDGTITVTLYYTIVTI